MHFKYFTFQRVYISYTAYVRVFLYEAWSTSLQTVMVINENEQSGKISVHTGFSRHKLLIDRNIRRIYLNQIYYPLIWFQNSYADSSSPIFVFRIHGIHQIIWLKYPLMVKSQNSWNQKISRLNIPKLN